MPRGEQGSWVNMCFDPQGRVIVSNQNGLLYRVTMSQAQGTITSALKNVRTGIALDPGLFRWAAPQGAKLIEW